ncbi:MAG: amidohydrolase [Prolixibacteraceae bacterium]|jgi:predicted amidohydrolase
MVQENLNIAVLQFDIVWENPATNLSRIDVWLSKIEKQTDLLVLPEMFTTGFSMNVSELAETMDGNAIQWMIKQASNFQMAICGSLIILENGDYFNRLIFAEPSGEIHFYDKRHLFTMGNEKKHYRRGNNRLIVNYKGWRICLLICYDLRFPVWARNRNEYDLLIYSADWPKPRKEVWNTLLKARAIENQAYVAGANRVGVDGNSIPYSGDSQIVSPKGLMLADGNEEKECIVAASLSHTELLKFRNDFPVLNDADEFTLN